jgi:hypothetical protein
MGIESWPDREEREQTDKKTAPVDEPRRHMLGSFRPGQGFAPSEVDENDDTLTAPIDLDTEDAPFPDSDETLDAHLGHR